MSDKIELKESQTNFREYLTERIESSSVNSYFGYIRKINEILNKSKITTKELLEITDINELDSVIQELDLNDEYKEYNIKWKNGLSAPLNHYRKFIEIKQLTTDKEEKYNFKKYLKQFSSSTFESIKINYSSLFTEVFKTEKDWMYPVENKLHHIRREEDRNAIKDVIEKLKLSDYFFIEADKSNLSTFCRLIDKTINASNFINNYTVSNLQENGLTIFDFFNNIKTSKSLAELKAKVNLKGTLLSFIPYFFPP